VPAADRIELEIGEDGARIEDLGGRGDPPAGRVAQVEGTDAPAGDRKIDLEGRLDGSAAGPVRVPREERIAGRSESFPGNRDPRGELRAHRLEVDPRDLRHAREADVDLVVHRVDRAAADRVVRVVLERDAPRVVEHGAARVAAREREPRGERLDVRGERAVVREVGALLPDPGRRAARKERRAEPRAQLAAVQRAIRGRLGARARRELDQRADLERGVRDSGERGLERRRQTRLRLDVIAPVHQQEGRDARGRREERDVALEPRAERRRLERERDGVAVAVPQVHRRESRAVGRLPVEERLVDGGGNAAPHHGRLEAEAREDLRELTDVAEEVGGVAEPHRRTERGGALETDPEVADQRLPRDEPLVREDVPRPDEEPPVAHELRDPVALAGPHLEVIVEDDRLAVEREAAERGIAVEDLEQAVHEAHEAVAELLVRRVPLAVPMGVRNEKEMAPRHGAEG
jgi:hypothetical protein